MNDKCNINIPMATYSCVKIKNRNNINVRGVAKIMMNHILSLIVRLLPSVKYLDKKDSFPILSLICEI